MTFSERQHPTKTDWPPILLGQPFPNPPMEDGMVFLACVGDVSAPVGVALVAENGEVKYRSVHELPRHGGTIMLDLAEAPPGSYNIHVHCNGWEEWRPLTIAPQVVVPSWRIVLEKWKEAVLSVFFKKIKFSGIPPRPGAHGCRRGRLHRPYVYARVFFERFGHRL